MKAFGATFIASLAGFVLAVAFAWAQAESVTGQLQIEPADEPPGSDGVAISFNAPLTVDDPALRGRSIEELIVGGENADWPVPGREELDTFTLD